MGEIQNLRDFPVLTVEKVLQTFQRINQIKTPEINSKLAIPYNKPILVTSVEFKENYCDIKSDLRKISGKSGHDAYQREKDRRKSLPFEWPVVSSENEGKSNIF